MSRMLTSQARARTASAHSGRTRVDWIVATAAALALSLVACALAAGARTVVVGPGGTVAGGVATYRVAGKQYVVAASGNSSKSVWFELNTGAATIIVFGLP